MKKDKKVSLDGAVATVIPRQPVSGLGWGCRSESEIWGLTPLSHLQLT